MVKNINKNITTNKYSIESLKDLNDSKTEDISTEFEKISTKSAILCLKKLKLYFKTIKNFDNKIL